MRTSRRYICPPNIDIWLKSRLKLQSDWICDCPLSLLVPSNVSNSSLVFVLVPYSLYSCFLINTADRIIRVYDGREILTCGRDGEPEPMQKLQDLVNRYCRHDQTDMNKQQSHV